LDLSIWDFGFKSKTGGSTFATPDPKLPFWMADPKAKRAAERSPHPIRDPQSEISNSKSKIALPHCGQAVHIARVTLPQD
jgi:hypothetical protein